MKPVTENVKRINSMRKKSINVRPIHTEGLVPVEVVLIKSNIPAKLEIVERTVSRKNQGFQSVAGFQWCQRKLTAGSYIQELG